MNDHEKDCACHEHTHEEHHHHGDACGCGCGHHHHHHEEIEVKPIEGMTVVQQNMLLALYERRYLPVACFTLTKDGDDELSSIALAPVYLVSPTDTMEDVKALGAQLSELEAGGLLTLDYDLPLNGYEYSEYKASELYAYFARTVEEAKDRPDFLFDTANLELGSMALTELGEKTVGEMLEEASR